MRTPDKLLVVIDTNILLVSVSSHSKFHWLYQALLQGKFQLAHDILLEADEDDNKFVDCAFAANAHYIVTHDSHFNVLRTIQIPCIPIVDIHQFKNILKKKE